MKDLIINDNHQFLNIVRCVCFECKHFDVSNVECPAFGIDIPIPILRGKMRHDKPLHSQNNNIVFEPLEA